MPSEFRHVTRSAGIRLFISVLVGLAVLIALSIFKVGQLSLLLGWDSAVIVFVAWVWLIIGPMGHEKTARFALRQDPTRIGADIILILASLASLGAVGDALFRAHSSGNAGQSITFTAVAVFSVALAWFLMHTVYTLRYARLYYSKKLPDAVIFQRDHNPTFTDFAYLAFTIGMTYQVSDNTLVGTAFRKTVLQHALLSYVFGTVIVASTVSLLVNFGN